MSAMHKRDSPAPTLEHIMSAIAGAEASRDELREMIAAAFAAARREGAEQMREAIAHQAEINALYGVHGTTVSTIRALPLPTGPRQAVRLADEEALSALPDCHGQSLGKTWLLSAARAIETAVLAANGLETK
jgi:hypothetical protein